MTRRSNEMPPEQQAERLFLITQRVGFALWQLQELEGVAAHYVVLVTQARKGMGSEAGMALLGPVLRLPFGGILNMITNAGLLDADLQTRFKKILGERNWLVHKSCSTSRDARFSDPGTDKVVERVDALAEEARSLLQVLGLQIEGYVREQGVSMKDVDERASALLEQWHASDES
jgi:hypothetical protein